MEAAKATQLGQNVQWQSRLHEAYVCDRCYTVWRTRAEAEKCCQNRAKD